MPCASQIEYLVCRSIKKMWATVFPPQEQVESQDIFLLCFREQLTCRAAG